MKLLTKEVERRLPAIYAQDGKGEDAIAYVRFFCPWGTWTWYGTEYDPATRTFFGRVDGHESELGSFSLDELESVRGPMGLGIERDLYWTPRPLKECK